MNEVWVLLTAVVVSLILGFLFYKSMKGYVRKEFGKKWLTLWGNKLYFWQSLVFVTLAGTVLIMYLLKWVKVLTF